MAAVRVDAGPLDRVPAHAALQAVNYSFVRVENKRFWLGCMQINPVGFSSYTLLEQAAEACVQLWVNALSAQLLTRFPSPHSFLRVHSAPTTPAARAVLKSFSF